MKIKNREHLRESIEQAIKLAGTSANLNYFDVSELQNFAGAFEELAALL
mgnify:FL=1